MHTTKETVCQASRVTQFMDVKMTGSRGRSFTQFTRSSETREIRQPKFQCAWLLVILVFGGVFCSGVFEAKSVGVDGDGLLLEAS